MTDTTEGDQPKKLKGFANKAQRGNIRKAGRAVGSKNKKTSLTHKELSDLFSSNTPEVFRRMMKLMKEGNESTQKALMMKFMDTTINISIHNEKMKLDKTDGKGKTSSYEMSQEGNGTTGQVVTLKFDD